MRMFVAAAAIAAGVICLSQNAQAFPAPSVAVQGESAVHDIAYVCRRVRTCGPYGCGWHRRCWETGPYRGYYGGYYGGYESPTAHVCAPGWSFQDGRCKPYRGP